MDGRWALFALVAACAGPDAGPEEHSVTQAVTQCPDQVVEGVDVSSFNGTIAWDAVKSGGRDFAFIKVSQGTYNKQTATIGTYWPGALAAGVIRSPYHFFDPTDDGVAQANYFLTQLAADGGLQVGDLPPMLDIECPVSSSQSSSMSQDPNCEYTGNDGWVDSATLQQRIFDWLDTVQTATGMTPIIYSYVSWFASTGVTDARLANYPLYIASYNACATIPSPWTTAVFWQYSASGTGAGISGNVDVDRFFGSAADLATYTMQGSGSGSGSSAIPDAGMNEETPDAGTITDGDHAGCGCQSGGSPGGLALGAAVLMIVLRRRKVAR